MFHRPHGALRLPRTGESRKYLEIFIWMLIGLVVYVMIRFVLADIVRFARMPDVPHVTEWSTPPIAVIEPAHSP